MNGRKIFRAWKFYYPELDAPEESAGLQVSPTGRIEMVEMEASIRQSILLLLATEPGERVMRPDFGCELRRLLFSPNDDTTAGLAIHYVRQALLRWEPRIDILYLDAVRDEAQPEGLNILLEYRVRRTQTVDRLAFSIHPF